MCARSRKYGKSRFRYGAIKADTSRAFVKPTVPSAIPGVSLEMLKMSPFGILEDTVPELKLNVRKISGMD